MVETKLCKGCLQDLSLDNFPVVHTIKHFKRYGPYAFPYCFTCERKRAWSKNLKKQFNLSVEQYMALLETQDYKCAICNSDVMDHKRRLDVDHNHDTGEVRGL